MGAPPWIVKFYVFDLKYGVREEDQHEKVLFYYPPDTDQVKDHFRCSHVRDSDNAVLAEYFRP